MSVAPLKRRWRPLVAGTVAVAAAGATAWLVAGTGTASAGSLSGTLYRSPTSQAISWVNANPNDYRAAVIRDRITTQPTARWFTSANVGAIQASVSSYVNAAYSVNQVPQLIPYALPNRDCGGASAGGAPDLATYQSWIQNFARGLGTGTALVLLEPDSLALQTCLSATEAAARNAALATAVRTIKQANPNAKVYLDAGHSAWNSAAESARRLNLAGVQEADGFYTNLSNFRLTANEVAFGQSILAVLNNSRLHQVIDVSRNGNGPNGSLWCDPPGRLIGPAPTLNTGYASVDALIWAKPPGEADGCRAGAGTFVPDLAYELAGSGTVTAPTTRPTTAVTTRPTTAPTTRATTPPTTRPTTAPTTRATTAPTTVATTGNSAGGCTAAYRVVGQWQGGFQGEVVVTNGSAPITGWTVTFTFTNGQTITQIWGGRNTPSGATQSVRNDGWNGALAANATASFGFIGSSTGTNNVPGSISCTRA